MTDLQKSFLLALRNIGPRAPASVIEMRAAKTLEKDGLCMDHEGKYRITPKGERALEES